MARRPSSYDSFPASESSRRPRTDRQGDADFSPSPRDVSSYSRSAYTRGSHARRESTTDSAYSRRSARDEYARTRAKKSHRKKVLIGVASVLAALVIGGGAAALAYVGILNGKLTGDIGDDLASVLDSSKAASDPFYILLMGVDRSQEREGSAEYGDSFRSDSMILARVDPREKKMTLISIVRDTCVNIDGYGENKINAAHALGGPALTVKTVSEFAGVPISHYAEIDFDGFKAAVDALGGVDVDVPMEIDDEDAGGYVAAGPQTLSGDEALILCRARHAYDEIGAGDFYRAANQRMVMGAIAKKILASDVVTMANTINAMADYITTDMDVQSIVSIATEMHGMDVEEDMYSAMNPTTPAYVDDVWYEYCNLAAWREMMGRVDAGLPPYADEERNANTGGTLDGKVTGVQELGTDASAIGTSATESSVAESADAYGTGGSS